MQLLSTPSPGGSHEIQDPSCGIGTLTLNPAPLFGTQASQTSLLLASMLSLGPRLLRPVLRRWASQGEQTVSPVSSVSRQLRPSWSPLWPRAAQMLSPPYLPA